MPNGKPTLMDEKQFGRQLALFRRESGLTQDEMAERLHISPQAVSKWENGRSLPETALIPEIARLLDVSIDTLFNAGGLVILEAFFGDGIEAADVTKRLNRLIENETLNITASAALLGANVSAERASYLTVKYQSSLGVCYSVCLEGENLSLSGGDAPKPLPEAGLSIIAGRYGTKRHNYDIQFRIEHFRFFNFDAYPAEHHAFPSDPANDGTEYLTLVYLNKNGVHMATCAEGESLAYAGEKTRLIRRTAAGEYLIPNVPVMPPFGEGRECSWADALTAALRAMGVETVYTEVMGVSGACYRLAFCSPTWDYSSVDGLVAYDYATPGYAAFGYTPEMHCNIEKAERAEHRARIAKELRNNMPVLGINLRVAHEWGVICGYAMDGEELFCRTKFDIPTISNDPEFMEGHPEFKWEHPNPYDYLLVDNWPFLFCYFTQRRKPPTAKENLLASLRIFADCAVKTQERGYFMGFKAYEAWASDLRNDALYDNSDDEQLARRFSVDQFCALALSDARKAAFAYLNGSIPLLGSGGERDALFEIAKRFEKIAGIAEETRRMLDSGAALDGGQARMFWTREKRYAQADALDEIARLEREAYKLAQTFIERYC